MFVNQSFTNAKVAEDHVEHILDVDASGQAAKRNGRRTQLFGDHLLALALVRLGERPVDGGKRFLERPPMPGAGYQRTLGRRKIVPRMRRQRG